MPWKGNNEIMDTSELVTRTEAHVIYVNQSGDTMAGDLNMNFNKLTNAQLQDCLVHMTSASLPDDSIISKAYLDQRLTGLDAIYVNEAGDTIDGEISMGRHKITNLRRPENATDAVNKDYADRHRDWFTFGENKLQIHKSVDMNSKKITEVADPTVSTDVVNKKYVDSAIQMNNRRFNNHLTLESTKLGVKLPIDMNSSRITEVGDPVDDTDAVNKKYLKTVLQMIPKFLPFHLSEDVDGKVGSVEINNINVDTNDQNKIIVLVGPNPKSFGHSMEITGTTAPYKLTVRITVRPQTGSTKIGRVVIHGVIMVLPSYTAIDQDTHVNVYEERLRSDVTDDPEPEPDSAEQTYILTPEAQRALM